MTNNASEFYEMPAVLVFVAQPLPEGMEKPILWGLEEEGIPARVEENKSGEATSLAKTAAKNSMLNVGIGINKNEVVLHHRELPLQEPLFVFGPEELTPENLRLVGTNAARLAKGNPLVMPERLSGAEA